MHETPAAHFVRRGFHASCGMFSELYPVGSLPPRGAQGIWGGRRLGYELGLRILNGWVPLLGGKRCGYGHFEFERLLGPRRLLCRKACPGLEADCGMQLPLGACLGNCETEFCFIVGRTFRNVPQPESVSQNLCSKRDGVSAVLLLVKKASGAVASEAFRLHANERVSCSWSDARRRGRSCIPRRWG